MTNLFSFLSSRHLGGGGRARLGFITYSECSLLINALQDWRWKDNLDLSPYGKAV